jgi:hypothetical protein
MTKDTYHSRTKPDEELGGRFSKPKATAVVGTTPTPYPKQPASSPWAVGTDEVTGVEPAFGVDVEAHEPVGTEKKEVQSSLATLKPPENASPSVEDRREPVADALPPSAAGSSTSMKRRV